MPTPNKPPGGKCPQDENRESCPLECKYNHFQSEDLEIHAWELKCTNCGWRDTIGYRSDDEDEDEDEPTVCPFCNDCDLKPGKNPCK